MADIIFVFGSNLAGRHGAGAAKTAHAEWGAEYGVGEGRTGNAYAIPTKDEELKTLPLEAIKISILKFMRYAEEHPEDLFLLTRVGCGLAGYTDDDMRPLFQHSPENVQLPFEWWYAKRTPDERANQD